MKNLLFAPHVTKTKTVKRLTRNVYDHLIMICGVNSDQNVSKFYQMQVEHLKQEGEEMQKPLIEPNGETNKVKLEHIDEA